MGDEPSGTATFSAASSAGPIVRYQWFELNASQPFAEGVTAERALSDFGQFWTRLRVEGAEGQNDEESIETVVRMDLTRGDPVLGFVANNRYGTDSMAIAYMLPTGTKVNLAFKLLQESSGGGGGSWNPDHTRLVFVHDNDIWVANRDGTALEKIIDTEWVAHRPDWSPTGEWIAYDDDSHDGLGPPDLLYVARPDGTDVTLVGGDPTDWSFSVSHPSWDPTGTRIAAKARWEIEPGVTKWRIVIFSNLWGTATRQALHTEEQIEAVFGPPEQYDVREGGNGVAWSSDGEWIAYAAMAVPPDVNQTEYMLAIARADGSGDIRILVTGDEVGMPTHPTWSPDGQTIYFMRSVSSGYHIFSIPASGGTETDLSAITRMAADDLFPFF